MLCGQLRAWPAIVLAAGAACILPLLLPEGLWHDSEDLASELVLDEINALLYAKHQVFVGETCSSGSDSSIGTVDSFLLLSAVDDQYDLRLAENLVTSVRKVGMRAELRIAALGPLAVEWCERMRSRWDFRCADERRLVEEERLALGPNFGCGKSGRSRAWAQGACFTPFFLAKLRLIAAALREFDSCRPVLWLDADVAFAHHPGRLFDLGASTGASAVGGSGGGVASLTLDCEPYSPELYGQFILNGSLILGALRRSGWRGDEFLEKNVGAVLYLRTPSTMLLLDVWYELLRGYPQSFEQVLFNVILLLLQRDLASKEKNDKAPQLQIRCLPVELSGNLCIQAAREHLPSGGPPPPMVHATCTRPERKAEALARHGAWYL